MERTDVEIWVDRYEQLWRTPDTDRLTELFTSDATYLPSPWARPLGGLGEIATFWEAERETADEVFTMSRSVVAVDGDTAVVRVYVEYAGVGAGRWRDLWVLGFSPDGRCSSFEEWPFAPEQPDGHEAI
jgi:ketosteroid isomerase-like protein